MIGLGCPEYVFRRIFVTWVSGDTILDLWSIYHKRSVGDPTTIATLAREDAYILGNVAAKVWWVEYIG